jgi:NAD(P)-dependent dehydrogenase (short-subunit alcohol dehydrogenase family)
MTSSILGRMDGVVAAVTGAGEGQGRATALLFAAEGARVIAADISGKEAGTASDTDGDITPVHCDVSQPSDVEAMVDLAMARHGRLDVLCNVAGIAVGGGMLADENPDNWDRVLDVNLKGVFLGIKYGAPAIVASGGGSILNWGSIGGMIASGMAPGYSASKAAVISLTRNAAIQYSPLGVRINCICPGFVLTPMIGKGRPPDPPEVRERMLATMRAKSLLGRETTAEEIAEVALWLCSPAASFLTGVALPVDGGWSIRSV